jgi:HK97 family phage major capsid protein
MHLSQLQTGIETEAMPTDTGDLSDEVMLVFGDLRKGVEFVDRRGVCVALSEHRYWEQRPRL